MAGDPRISQAPELPELPDSSDDVSATWPVDELAKAPSPEETLVSPAAREARSADVVNAPTLQTPGSAASIEAASYVRPSHAAGPPPSTPDLDVTEEHAGRYVVRDDDTRGELGRGGIGRVFAALDRHLERDVAIKELLPDIVGDSSTGPGLAAMSRFLREARVTGQLEHPNIVPVYELGRRADGTLYYTMRIVRGRTLARAIADAKDLRERLALVNHFSGLCQAIAYAHSRGVVHRDVKPQNVMIGEFGETVVLDWGTAKVRDRDALEPASIADARDTFAVDATVEGSIVGTPIYMSPEQARGRASEVDERSDVWALGIVLYTILAGRPPFDGRSFGELRRQLERGTMVPLLQVDGRVPPELAAIVDRALRRAPKERYPSAKEMAADVQAYQAGGRVGAYEYSSLELLKRFLDRQRAAVMTSLVGLAVIVVLAIASYHRVVAARDAAEASARTARKSLSEMLVEKSELALADGDAIAAELLAAHALDIEERPDARGVVLTAESSSRPTPIASLQETADCGRYAMAAKPRLLACAKGSAVRLWSVADGKLRWSSDEPSDVGALAISADGGTLVCADANGALRVLANAGDRYSLVAERRVAGVSSLAVSADGALVAFGGSSGAAVVWEVNGTEWRLGLGQPVSVLTFAPSATDLVVGGELGAVSFWNWQSGRDLRLKGHTGTVRAFAFAGGGRLLASGGADRTLRFWDTQDARALWEPIANGDAITSISWSQDARLLAFGSKDKSFRLLDPRGAGHGVKIEQHDDAVELVALSPDGGELFSASHDTGLRVWSLASLKTPSQLVERGNVLSLAFDAKTQNLLSAGLGRNGVSLWDSSTGTLSTRLPASVERVRSLAVSPGGDLLALAGSGGQVFLWDMAQRIPIRVLEGHRDEVRALTFSSDGKWLASAALDRAIRIVDAANGEPVAELEASAGVQALVFAPKSASLLSGDRDGMLEIHDVAHATRVARWKAHDEWVLAAAISPDGKLFASGGGDRIVRLWSADARKLLFDLVGHEGKVTSVEFSPDGSLLASAGEDKSIRLWEVRSGRELARLTGHDGTVRSVKFAPARPVLASGGDDGIIRLWNLANLRQPAAEVRASTEQRFGVELTGTRLTWRAAHAR